jgi:aminoglycoside 3-N-acetyltransferase
MNIKNDLRMAGVNSKGTLLVHSALSKVKVDGERVLDSFIDYMRDGLLILPTHTWMEVGYKVDENPQNKIYDPQTSKSCVGTLTNLFLKRPGVVRSLHPTHSVAAIGSDAVEYTAGEELTRSPCSREGCYGKLYDRNAQILFLGCDLTKNTFIHGVEEWNKIPERLTEAKQELFVRVNGELIPCSQNRHVEYDVSKNYNKIEAALIKSGAARYCKIGKARCVLCDAVKMADLVSELLAENPRLFSE